MPDSVFVEDIAIVFDELAIITRPGAESRRARNAGGGRGAGRLSAAARRFSRRARWTAATCSSPAAACSSAARRAPTTAAVAQMRQLLAAARLHGVATPWSRGCLHLKSAVTGAGDDLLLVNPDMDRSPTRSTGSRSSRSIRRSRRRRTRCGSTIGVMFSSAFPRTAERLARAGSRAARGRCERAGEGRRRGHMLQPDRRQAVVRHRYSRRSCEVHFGRRTR